MLVQGVLRGGNCAYARLLADLLLPARRKGKGLELLSYEQNKVEIDTLLESSFHGE